MALCYMALITRHAAILIRHADAADFRIEYAHHAINVIDAIADAIFA